MLFASDGSGWYENIPFGKLNEIGFLTVGLLRAFNMLTHSMTLFRLFCVFWEICGDLKEKFP